MCPACLATTAWLVAGAASAGGLAAFVARVRRNGKEKAMEHPRIVSREEWLRARRAHLAKEKELTRLRDRVSAEGRALPWVRIEKEYVFEGPDGRETLAQLFAGRSQLVIYHFMFGPGWAEGCVGCSFLADHLDGPLRHLGQRDVELVVVSRAPFAELEAFRKRMGWRFKWVSSAGSDFNYDFGVSFTPEAIARGEAEYNFAPGNAMGGEEAPGTSVFARGAAGEIFHTYSTFGRGDETLIGTYTLLDLVPKGRDETGQRGDLTDWVKHHDRYVAS
jgi:predicted dithiol-disulfide oxidoreductase (DUF899 family)